MLCMAPQCVCFTRVSTSFKTSYAFSPVCGHNACISHVYLYRLGRLTRFPLYWVTVHVFFTFLCTSVSLSFKKPYAFSSVWLHNACVSHVYLYRLGRFQRFPLYCVTMRVFYTFLCTRVSLSFKTPYAFSSVRRHSACVLLAFLHVLDVLHVFLCIASQCVCFSRFSALAFLYRFSSVWRHNAYVLLKFLHRFRRLTRFPP